MPQTNLSCFWPCLVKAFSKMPQYIVESCGTMLYASKNLSNTNNEEIFLAERKNIESTKRFDLVHGQG